MGLGLDVVVERWQHLLRSIDKKSRATGQTGLQEPRWRGDEGHLDTTRVCWVARAYSRTYLLVGQRHRLIATPARLTAPPTKTSKLGTSDSTSHDIRTDITVTR